MKTFDQDELSNQILKSLNLSGFDNSKFIDFYNQYVSKYEQRFNYEFLNKNFSSLNELDIYLFKLAERLERGNIAPISYVENTIRDILFNQKKLELLRSFDNDVLQDAIKSKKFEKY